MESRTIILSCIAVAVLAAAAFIILPPAPVAPASVPVPAGPAPPALRPGTPGMLTITSTPPGAEVWIDTDPGPSATTPATLALSPIIHPVMLRHPGYRDYVTSVDVLPGANVTIAVVMEPGS